VAPLLAAIGILGALHVREKTGDGQRVDISMLDGIIFCLIPRPAYFFIKGASPPLTGNEHYQVAPYNSFRTRDGGSVTVIVHTPKHWQNFCAALGRPEWVGDPRFKSNGDRLKNSEELNRLLGGIFQEKDQKEWIEGLAPQGVMIAPVYNFEQLFQDPQVVHDEMVVEIEHPEAGRIKMLRTPIRLSKYPLRIKSPPPLLGQHTEEIFSKIGLSPEEIRGLKGKRSP
jgi:CoA:oxalate CoA-transferase